ncbi:MAG: hypothetical protein E6G20_02795 [Actinobacteria bacterium]|nr:MAG: hypothetical protein E6G20_02795 [Actinomycetota bacterium]
MPRGRKPSTSRELPPPLPPERRTVGQAVAEAVRLYGARFAKALPLGLVVATANQLTVGRGRPAVTLVLLLAAPAFTLAFAYATRLTLEVRTPPRSWLVALVVGTLAFVPAALLFPWFALASVLWLALVGLSVPAAVVEGSGLMASFRRGVELARAGYLHAAGAFVTFAVLFALTRTALALVLRSQADNTVRTAIFLADTIVAPLLFLGAVIVYVDLDARLRSRGERGKERDADVPDAHDAHREGRPDAAREPGPVA